MSGEAGHTPLERQLRSCCSKAWSQATLTPSSLANCSPLRRITPTPQEQGRPGMWFNKNGLITSALVWKNPASLFQLRASQFPLQWGAGALGPKQIALSNASRYLDMWRPGGHSGKVRIREVPGGFACHGAPILPRG